MELRNKKVIQYLPRYIPEWRKDKSKVLLRQIGFRNAQVIVDLDAMEIEEETKEKSIIVWWYHTKIMVIDLLRAEDPTAWVDTSLPKMQLIVNWIQMQKRNNNQSQDMFLQFLFQNESMLRMARKKLTNTKVLKLLRRYQNSKNE